MKKSFLSGLVFAALCAPCLAQDTPHVVRGTVNADSENAEFCLEFDKTLPAVSPQKLAGDLHLEAEGVSIKPANIVAGGTSLCLFPLERGKAYHLSLSGVLAAGESGLDKKALHYKTSFTIPDRSPSLSFTAKDFPAGSFAPYALPLTLRAVNVAHAHIDVYRITDSAAMARAWQDRAQTSLAPSESAYLARDKGQKIWQSDEDFTTTSNATAEHEFSLRDKMPDLAPGLYLILADAGQKQIEPANKGLAPLAAAWFTKSDFSVRAVRDDAGIHVFAARTDRAGAKSDLHLTVMNRKPESAAEAQADASGTDLILYPSKSDRNDLTSLVATDPNGNVAFADIENLPALSEQPDLGFLTTDTVFATPGQNVSALLVLNPTENKNTADGSFVRLLQNDSTYADYPIPALTQGSASVSFPAPARQGLWVMRWQKPGGTVLADNTLRVSSNPDAPHLELSTGQTALEDDGAFSVTVKSLALSGKPVAVAQGHVTIGWQKLNPENLGWKDYIFGVNTGSVATPTQSGDFSIGPEGTTQIRVTPPKMPQERGLYQAVLKAGADPDAGILEAKPLTLPLHGEMTAIGIKPLAENARFAQNGLARFALIGLSSDGKPRNVSDLSYQIYEEGRSFAWYQNEGRWQYRPEPQLRPIGSGALSIKSDGSSILEWPVTSGNYRVAIVDGNGKLLAQTSFSAGWDRAAAIATRSLSISLPHNVKTGHEVTAHINLPQESMLTVLIADTHVRKIIHELRPKGDNKISFTPAGDWSERISISAETAGTDANGGVPARGSVEAILAQNTPNIAAPSANVVIIAGEDPSGLLLQKQDKSVLTFGIENNGANDETYSYSFSASPGLQIAGGERNGMVVGRKQSRSLSVAISALQSGIKNIRLDVTGTHGQHASRNWNLTILPKAFFLRSEKPITVARQQNFVPATSKPRGTEPMPVLVAQMPLEGAGELLSFLIGAHPTATAELALSIDALRLWQPVLTQSGFVSSAFVAARRDAQINQMLAHQNADGGFSAQGNSESTIEDTASALTAFGPDNAERLKPVKNLATSWLKQRLSNSWIDEKERAPRAAAYAALAAADEIDAASLHYFSDSNASLPLPALAEVQIAAAFKHIRDPDAAAFWIKKMLDEHGNAHSNALLNALAATDALSSDEVLTAVVHMATGLRNNTAPNLADAAGLLRALVADLQNAGKIKITNGKDTKSITGIFVLNASDPAASTYRNADAQNLFATPVVPAEHKNMHAPRDE